MCNTCCESRLNATRQPMPQSWRAMKHPEERRLSGSSRVSSKKGGMSAGAPLRTARRSWDGGVGVVAVFAVATAAVALAFAAADEAAAAVDAVVPAAPAAWRRRECPPVYRPNTFKPRESTVLFQLLGKRPTLLVAETGFQQQNSIFSIIFLAHDVDEPAPTVHVAMKACIALPSATRCDHEQGNSHAPKGFAQPIVSLSTRSKSEEKRSELLILLSLTRCCCRLYSSLLFMGAKVRRNSLLPSFPALPRFPPPSSSRPRTRPRSTASA